MILLSLLLAQAQVAPVEAPLPGIWSVAEARDCSAGEAWVFTADGYYAEVTLPASPIHAIGIWEDKGTTLEYTHAHMPFPEIMKAQQRRAFRITARSSDRIEALNYKGERRVFHRCPAGALRPDAKH